MIITNKPKSSAVKEYTYNSETKALSVVYSNNDNYTYQNISNEDFDGLQNATSVGKKLKSLTVGKPYTKQ